MDIETIAQRATLKGFIKQISQITFKFKRLWIIVEQHNNPPTTQPAITHPSTTHPPTTHPPIPINPTLEATGMASLYSSLSQFPLEIVVRLIPTSALSTLFFSACNETAKSVCVARDCLRSSFTTRPYFTPLRSAGVEGVQGIAFLEHCAFLQQFPTINYFFAAQLLGALHERTRRSDRGLGQGQGQGQGLAPGSVLASGPGLAPGQGDV